jgi:cobyrinic acid a,c-diamide synthase
VFGGIPVVRDIALPSRHLGLFMGEEGVLENRIDRLAETISEHIDLDEVLAAADMDIEDMPLFNRPSERSKGRIAVAKDNAFCFYYEDNFEILKHLGYEIVFFSPIKDRNLPENIKAIYLGGGYPELYAEKLSQNSGLRRVIKEESEKGTASYAECGGLMYLGESLTTPDGTDHQMCGCLPYKTVMRQRLQSLGYAEISPKDNFLFLRKKENIKGHSFHYSEMIMESNYGVESFYDGTPVDKARGVRLRNTLVSYVHLHLGSYLY